MENEMNGGNINNGSNNNGVKGSFLCRQSSSRWTPTTDQIRILKELYYNDGVRSPSAEQIQRISADLRRYGKIEGKNVFYWFQNHKARERQKKRFTTTTANNNNTNNNINNGLSFNALTHSQAPAAAAIGHHTKNNWNTAPGRGGLGFSSSSSSSSAATQSSSGVLAFGHVGSYGYGSVTMEKSFRDCSISSAGGNKSDKVGGGQYNYGWGVGFDHHHHHPYTTTNSGTFFDKRKSSSINHHHEIEGHVVDLEDDDDGDDDDDHHDDDHHQEIETLPLFPTHREDMINGYGFYSGGGGIKRGSSASAGNSWYGGSDHCYDGINNGGSSGATTSFASLELSLNSFAAHSSDMF